MGSAAPARAAGAARREGAAGAVGAGEEGLTKGGGRQLELAQGGLPGGGRSIEAGEEGLPRGAQAGARARSFRGFWLASSLRNAIGIPQVAATQAPQRAPSGPSGPSELPPHPSAKKKPSTGRGADRAPGAGDRAARGSVGAGAGRGRGGNQQRWRRRRVARKEGARSREQACRQSNQLGPPRREKCNRRGGGTAAGCT